MVKKTRSSTAFDRRDEIKTRFNHEYGRQRTATTDIRLPHEAAASDANTMTRNREARSRAAQLQKGDEGQRGRAMPRKNDDAERVDLVDAQSTYPERDGTFCGPSRSSEHSSDQAKRSKCHD